MGRRGKRRKLKRRLWLQGRSFYSRGAIKKLQGFFFSYKSNVYRATDFPTGVTYLDKDHSVKALCEINVEGLQPPTKKRGKGKKTSKKGKKVKTTHKAHLQSNLEECPDAEEIFSQ